MERASADASRSFSPSGFIGKSPLESYARGSNWQRKEKWSNGYRCFEKTGADLWSRLQRDRDDASAI